MTIRLEVSSFELDEPMIPESANDHARNGRADPEIGLENLKQRTRALSTPDLRDVSLELITDPTGDRKNTTVSLLKSVSPYS
jgi:hypothetical protein